MTSPNWKFLTTSKSTAFLCLVLFILFSLSIKVILEVQKQNDVIQQKLSEKMLKNTIDEEITFFEDSLAKLFSIEDFKKNQEINKIFPWALNVQKIDSPNIPGNELANLENIVSKFKYPDSISDLTYLNLAPLINASQNLKNRVFYGSTIKINDNLEILPLSIASDSIEGNTTNIIAWMDTKKFLNRVKNNTDLNFNYRLDLVGINSKISPNWTITSSSPDLNISINKELFSSNSTYYFLLNLFNSPQSLMIIGVNFLLWIAIGFTLFEHFRRMRSEQKLKDAIEKGLQQSRLASIGEVASGLAHEINQPLATIETYASITKKLLEKRHFDEELRRVHSHLEEIRNQTQRCSNITKSVLSLKKQNTVGLNYLKIKDVLDNIEPILELNAQKINARIEWDIHPKYLIFSNSVALEQILLNICINGLESMQNTSINDRNLILSSIKVEKNNKKYLQILVSDNGCGIDSSEKSNIFDPFTSYKKNGTGLGLSLCKSLAEKCQMEIDFHENKNQGTTFKLLVPASAQQVYPSQQILDTSTMDFVQNSKMSVVGK
jgi:signal transduction histidine kinase